VASRRPQPGDQEDWPVAFHSPPDRLWLGHDAPVCGAAGRCQRPSRAFSRTSQQLTAYPDVISSPIYPYENSRDYPHHSHHCRTLPHKPNPGMHVACTPFLCPSPDLAPFPCRCINGLGDVTISLAPCTFEAGDLSEIAISGVLHGDYRPNLEVTETIVEQVTRTRRG